MKLHDGYLGIWKLCECKRSFTGFKWLC